MTFFKIYLIAFVIFFAIDLLWLGVLAKDLYRTYIGYLMTDQIRWGAAVLFYLLFIFGLVFFAIEPSVAKESWVIALTNGALFGFICYASYDLTNLATIKDWPLRIVVYDLIWGTFISGSTSLITYFSASIWKKAAL